jgi:hypothetical protein
LDGNKIVKIAQLMRQPSDKELFDCLDNKEMVLELLPNRMEVVTDEMELQLVLRLQSFWKAHMARKYFRTIKLLKKNFVFLQGWMRIFYKHKVMKRRIFKMNQDYQLEFNERQEEFKVQWSQLKNEKRLEIHINSLGYDKFKRTTTNNYREKQNLQMSRMFRLRDPNLEIVIVTSTELPIDIMAYYVKILDVCGIPDAANRIHIIHPENSEKFKANNLCLSAVIHYSPITMKKLKYLSAGKNAYIVNGFPSNYDLLLAVKIGIPLLTGDPNLNFVNSQKHTSKCLFED